MHEFEQMPSAPEGLGPGLPGSPKAAGAAAGVQASPEIMRAVWQLDARQERVPVGERAQLAGGQEERALGGASGGEGPARALRAAATTDCGECRASQQW